MLDLWNNILTSMKANYYGYFSSPMNHFLITEVKMHSIMIDYQ